MGALDIGLGPILRYTDPRPLEGSPLTQGPGVGRVGGRIFSKLSVGAETPSTAGLRAEVKLEGFPAIWELERSMSALDATAEGRIPLPIGGTPPLLVLRAGGRHVWGNDFPVDESAFVGGSHSLRGFRHSRFAGRSSAFASAEVRIPVVDLEIVTKGRLGILGFEDVGRVWWDDEDSGTWHFGYGGGLWYETLDFLGRVMIAKGEETRYYIGLETPL